MYLFIHFLRLNIDLCTDSIGDIRIYRYRFWSIYPAHAIHSETIFFHHCAHFARHIFKLTYTENLESIRFHALFPEIVPSDDIFAFEKAVEAAIKVEQVRLACRYPSEKFGMDCYGELVKLLKRDIPVVNGFLDDAEVQLSNGELRIKIVHGGRDILDRFYFCQNFSRMIYNQFGVRVKVVLDGESSVSEEQFDEMIERIEADILNNFKVLGVQAYPLSGVERLRIMYETFNPEQTAPFTFQYDQILKTHIIPEIGTIKIAKVKPIHLNKMYRDLSEHRKDERPGGYPSSTIHRIHGVLSSVMSYAVKCGVIDNNPCQKATLPKEKAATLTEENYFTEKQAATFISYLNEPFTVTRRPKNRKEYTEIHTVPEQQKIFLTMALLTGCRRSELIALQWPDIDFDRKELHIRKATTIADHKLITEDPKTRKSYRKISLSDHLVDALREYRTHQLEKRLQIGSKWYDGDFVFTTWDGHQMRPETPYAAFKTILQRYNATHEEQLPDITLHGLRHTSATLLIAENTDIKTVASRLGHSRVGTTLDIYSHALESKDRAAADTLSSLIFHDGKSQ